MSAALLQPLGVDAGLVKHMQARDLLANAHVDAHLSEVAANPGVRRFLRTEFGGRRLRSTFLQMGQGAEAPSLSPLAILVEDLTEATSATPEVRQVEHGLESVVSAVDAVLWEADPRDWMFTMVSTPILALTGYPDVHFIGRPGAWPELIPLPDHDRFLAECAQLLPRQRFTIQHRLTTSTGGLRWVRTQITCSNNDSAITTYRGVSVDVSASVLEERRRLEAVGRLAGTIAHEMNGVLALIAGNMGLLAETTSATQATEIRAVHESVSRGAALTRRLQIFAQGAPLRLLPSTLNDLIQSNLQDLQLAVGYATQLTFDPEPDLGICAMDSQWFGSALINLVANARESIRISGQIRLATRNVPMDEIALAADVGSFAEHVEVSVSDTGSGMEDEVRIRATEPCFSTRSGAAGLGLSMVYGFVQQCRGHMVIESQEGHGTTVRLRFPRLQTPVPKIAPTAIPSPAIRQLLVVDDDRDIATLLQRILQRRLPDFNKAVTAYEIRGPKPRVGTRHSEEVFQARNRQPSPTVLDWIAARLIDSKVVPSRKPISATRKDPESDPQGFLGFQPGLPSDHPRWLRPCPYHHRNPKPSSTPR